MADRVLIGNVRGPQGNPGAAGAPGSPGAPGKDAIVDAALDENSTNAVQNAVVTKELNKVFQSVSDGKELVASAITDKGVATDATAAFEKMAGNIRAIESGGVDTSLISIKTRGILNIDQFVVSNFTYSSYYFMPYKDMQFQPGDKTWEIGVKIKYKNTNGRSQVIFGGETSYYAVPSLEINSNRGLWAGISTSGTTWNMGGASSQQLVFNNWYYIKYVYDGEKYYVDVSEDKVTWERYISFASKGVTVATQNMIFGGINQSDNHCFKYGYIGLKNTYFIVDGELIWGCKE